MRELGPVPPGVGGNPPGSPVYPHLGDVDGLAQGGERVQHPTDHHHIPGRKVELYPHNVKVHPRLQQVPEIPQRGPQMLRQRAVTGIPSRHIFPKGQAYVDNGLGLRVGLPQGFAAGAGQLDELGLAQSEAVGPVVGLIHGVPDLNSAFIPLHMMPRNLSGAGLELLKGLFILQPLGVDFCVAEPQGMALGLDAVLLQKAQGLVDIFVLILSLLGNGAVGIKGKGGEIKGLLEQLGVPRPRRGKPAEIAPQQKVVPGVGKGLFL